jgi:hypothetical protein
MHILRAREEETTVVLCFNTAGKYEKEYGGGEACTFKARIINSIIGQQ